MNIFDNYPEMYRIVGCALEVYSTLKYGYLESVYEAALEYELLQAGFSVKRQVRIPVFYKGVELKKDFYADMVIDDVLIELKAVSDLNRTHERQIQSYLKSTGMQKGLLINFGNPRTIQWKAYLP